MRRTSARRGSSSRQRGGFGRYRLTGRLALGAGVLVLLAGLVWVGVLLFSGSSDTDTEPEASPPAAVDTAASEPAEPAGPPLPEIGDSLEVTVVAATGVLEPVRVRTDGGEWNPYWIEEDDSMRFGATDAIELRSYLPRAELLVEGMSWSHSVASLSDSVLITREDVQERIDSMAAARGGTPAVAPDTADASPAPNP